LARSARKSNFHVSGAELFSQNAILLAEIVNSEQVMLVHPTGDGDP
jgi:hypothetical protein